MLRALLLLAVGALAAGESTLLTAPPPPALLSAEQAHTALFRSRAAAVVGLNCRGRNAAGEAMGFYGTGTLVSRDGLVLTSTTVVPPEATAIQVFTTDGKVRSAAIVEHHAATEAMLLRIADPPAGGCTFLPLGDARQAQVGDVAYTWGNPHLTIQRDGNVSLAVGAISGRYRAASMDDQSRYLGDAIEVDAAVNPGSDGGPVTDHAGNLIGVMSLAYARDRWLGLAVPVDAIARGLPTLAAITPVPRSAAPAGLSPHRDLVRAAAAVAAATVAITQAPAKSLPATRAQQADKLALPTPVEREETKAAESQRPLPVVASGLIIDAEGHIITCGAVAVDPKQPKKRLKTVTVWLPDGRRAEAEVRAGSSYHDLVLLRLKSHKPSAHIALTAEPALPPGAALAVLGRSQAPGGLTLNAGILSARDRYRDTCLQTSALINWGNLGGPCIDRDGRLMGIAVHLGSQTPWRNNCGVGFVLRAGVAAQVVDELKAGRVPKVPPRTYIGVQFDTGALDVVGARVVRLAKDGPAAKAGVKPGDIITAWAGTAIASTLAAAKAIDEAAPDQPVTLTIQRAGKPQTITITPVEHE